MSNMTTRIVTAVVMMPILLAAVIWLERPTWTIFVSVVAALAAREIAALASGAGIDASRGFIAIGTGALAWLAGLPLREPKWLISSDALLGTFVILVVAAFIGQLLRSPERRSAAAWAVAVAVPTYVGGMAAFVIRLRAESVAWVLCMLVLVWMNDSAAYFGGRAFGRRLMAPALSPKKTWEGLFVGTLATVAVAVGMATMAPSAGSIHLAPRDLISAPIWIAVALGMAVSVAGPLGDLSHSFIKRQFGAKDSSHLIPGHGGIWDRIDSLLFAAPVVYLVARLLS